jgi:integration host factor subunit beta
MTKAELVDQVAATVQLPKNTTDAVITHFLQGIMEALHAGGHVELRGFGSFRLRHRQARAGRNPRTGNPVQIPAKALPSFRVCVWNCEILRLTGGRASHKVRVVSINRACQEVPPCQCLI